MDFARDSFIFPRAAKISLPTCTASGSCAPAALVSLSGHPNPNSNRNLSASVPLRLLEPARAR